MKRLSALALFALSVHATAQGTATSDDFRRLMVVGDGRGALAALAPDSALRACVAARLAGGAAGVMPRELEGRPLAWTILQAYRAYWRAALAGGGDDAKAALLSRLGAVLPGKDWDRNSIDEATAQARKQLEAGGLHAITGVTWPFYELMLWSSEERKEYRVDLSDQQVTVPVVFMDGFASKGWLDYGSCNRFGAGGWTANGTLYAVRSRYDVNSEAFRVSYLGHEGRHFADNRDHPKLEQPELEYRAKLTELVLSRETTRKLFNQFLRSGQPGRKAPHAHAEFWLVQHMKESLLPSAAQPDWPAVPDQRLRDAAAALLAASAGKNDRFLPD